MNIPFSIGRANMDRLAFMTRPRDVIGDVRSDPNTQFPEDHDDRTPLSPHSPVDLEAQRTGPQEEMAERGTPTARFIHRFRPSIPSFLSVASSRWPGRPRPTSSNYSGDGMPPATMINGEEESPKTPQFRIGVQDLPSTRLHLPNLTRTWTQGSNGPPSRPATANTPRGNMRSPIAGAEGITEPSPAVLAAENLRTGSRGRIRSGNNDSTGAEAAVDRHGRRRRHRREGSDRSGRSNRSNRSNRSGNRSQRPQEQADETEDRESRRRRRRRREHRQGSAGNGSGEGSGSGSGSGSGDGSHRSDRPTPKRFLFCFPWVKSRRIRSQILRCFVSGMFLTLILTVYLSLSITKNINNSEFTVLLILIILFVTIFFCHGLIRLCMMVVRGGRDRESERARLPEMMGPGGYAIPRRPIRVVLARDEEAAGIDSEATKTDPPAYGRWRESVRVDPDRIYWMRNESAAPETVDEVALSDGGPERPRSDIQAESSTTRTTVPRPPSYASDDGVSYVVEAQPRSIAPTGEVPLRTSLHPAEAGRAGQPPAW